MNKKPFSLPVGATLQLERISGNVHYCFPVTLMGYQVGHSLMVSNPQPKAGLRVGEDFIVRSIGGETSYAFRATALALHHDPFPYMHLSFPEGVQGALSRRAPRVSLAQPSITLTMSDGDKQIKVSMADIGPSGARLVAAERLGSLGDTFVIDVRAPYSNRLVSLSCTIRYVRNDLPPSLGKGQVSFHHGVEFGPLNDEGQFFVNWLMQEWNRRSRQFA